MRHTKLPLFLCVLYLFFIGCSSAKEYSYAATDVKSFRNLSINKVTLKDGSKRTYGDGGGLYSEVKSDSGISKKIFGFDKENNPLDIDLERILEVHTRISSPNTEGTIILIGVCVSITLVLVILFGFNTQGSFL